MDHQPPVLARLLHPPRDGPECARDTPFAHALHGVDALIKLMISIGAFELIRRRDRRTSDRSETMQLTQDTLP